MENITILFSRSPKVGSYLIRQFTHSDWSHCAILTDKNHVIESTLAKGVAPTTLDEFLSHHTHVISITFSTDFCEEVYMTAAGEVGKPYDWTAIFGILANRNWDEPDSWFCSELVAFALRAAKLFLDELSAFVSKITPQDIFEILVKHGVIRVIKGVD